MPKYKIKQGFEHVVISQQGVRRLDESTVESDHELTNPLLTLVQAETTPTQPPQAAVAPAAPTVNQVPQAPVQEGAK